MSLSNAQYDAIMHGYETKRAKYRHDQAERLDYVYNHVPGYKELDESVSTVSVEHAKLRLSGEKVSPEDLQKKLSSISQQKKALLQEAGLAADYLELHYDCPDCKDTGYIGNEKCHCFRQQIIEYLYEESNIKRLAETANFSLMTDKYYTGEDLDRFHTTVKACEDFINNFDTDYQNIFFYGTVGTGKSFLSVCIAKELLDRGHSVVYFSSGGLFETLSENSYDYRKTDELHSLYEDLYSCDLLIIDDLGTERTNNFVSSELFSCLNERFNRKKSTIITTNLSIKELRDRYSDRIFSRITNNYIILKMSGKDIRFLKKLSKGK